MFLCVHVRETEAGKQSRVNPCVDFTGFPRVQELVVHQGCSVCCVLDPPKKNLIIYTNKKAWENKIKPLSCLQCESSAGGQRLV